MADNNITNSKFSDLLFSISYAFLVFIFCLFTFSFVGFIFHISINIFYPILSFISGIVALFFMTKYKALTAKYFWIGLLSYLTIFALAILFGMKFYDSSYDGRTYHQAGIMLLGQGWNPIYDNVNVFASKLYNTNFDPLIWTENYTKFAEIIQANIFVVFKKIEIAKMTNIISGFILLGYAFYVLNKLLITKTGQCDKNNVYKYIISGLVALLIVLNPVYVAQVMTFYIDSYVYLYFMLILLAIIDIEKSKAQNPIAFSVIIMSSVCLANVKLGGLLYIILPLSLYLVYSAYKKNWQNLKHSAQSILLILILIILSGINPYYTNIKQDRNPFYPLIGKNKMDVVTHCIPGALYEKNNIEKFILSTFSRVDNFSLLAKKKNHIKPPFWVYKGEFSALGVSDVRICGFGVFWSGILLLSIILAFFIRYNSKEDKLLFIFIFYTLILLASVNPYCWWARYAPHLWAIPIFVVISVFMSNKSTKLPKIIAAIILFFMFANFVIQTIFVSQVERSYRKSISNSLKLLETYDKDIKIYFIYDWSLIEKMKERKIKFVLVDDEYYNKNKGDFSVLDISLIKKMYWDYKEK